MSGALDPKIQQEIVDRDLYATAVLSGNRNSTGASTRTRSRRSWRRRSSWLRHRRHIRFDIERDALGYDAAGKPISSRPVAVRRGDRRHREGRREAEQFARCTSDVRRA